MNYKSAWLTLNRECNLRCKWCYAKGTNFKEEDNMKLDIAYKLIDICSDLNIKNICLLGGEPTMYKYLIPVIKYIKNKHIKVSMVTNGIKLAEESYLQELIENGLDSICISLKGENPQIYQEITGFNGFDKAMKGIENCNKEKIKFSVSMVLTENNIKTFCEGIKNAKQYGANNFNLSFCYEFNVNKQYHDFLLQNNPKKIIQGFIDSYEELDTITNHKFNLFQTYPLCLWDESFIKKMIDKHQVSSVCQLLAKTGLLFDTNASIIPCNAMYELKLGKLNNDFIDAKSLLEHINQNKIVKVYNRLCGIPTENCNRCKNLKNCGGGCVCQWTNYSYEELMKKVK